MGKTKRVIFLLVFYPSPSLPVAFCFRLGNMTIEENRETPAPVCINNFCLLVSFDRNIRIPLKIVMLSGLVSALITSSTKIVLRDAITPLEIACDVLFAREFMEF